MSTVVYPHVADAIVRTRAMNFAAGVIVLYDHMCSLDKEVEYVWRRYPWNLGSFLFTLNRYLPYVYILMAIEENWLVTSSTAACRNRDIANAILVSCGIISSGVILSLRTWAVWERNPVIKWILLIVVPINLAVVSVCFSFMFRNSPYISISRGNFVCFSAIEPSYWVTITFVIILILETQIAGLTLIKAIQARRSNSKWVFKIHYMGVVYYVYILLRICYDTPS